MPDFREQLWGFSEAFRPAPQQGNVPYQRGTPGGGALQPAGQQGQIDRMQRDAQIHNMQATAASGTKNKPTHKPAMLDPVKRQGIINRALAQVQPTSGPPRPMAVRPGSPEANPAHIMPSEPPVSQIGGTQAQQPMIGDSGWDWFMREGGG